MVSREAIVLLFYVFIVFNLINEKGVAAATPIFLVFNTVLIVVFVVHLLMTVTLLMLFAGTTATAAVVARRL